ncbi:MAG TPA: methyltransferase [Candidatus Polarisedimenticolia bacterium]|nr:methyltransferase [Candidatus Polarisedimenticolia bacterium]
MKKKVKKKKLGGGKPLPGQMLDLVTGYWVSQLVYVAAKLELADRLAKGPKTAADLAAETGANPIALHRILRALAGVGVFKETAGGRFKLTPLAGTLRTGVPGSMRDFAVMMVEDYNWEAWQDILESVRNGEAAFPRVHGMKIFEYYEKHPEKGGDFARAMSSLSGTENPAIAAAYDFSALRTLVDVGGSQGHLLAEILRRNRRLRGVLFDLPHAVERAKAAPYLNAKGLHGRIEFVAGDFFRGVPEGADAYIMKYILHDWDDSLCTKILKSCREALAPGGRVLVVDTVVPRGNAPHWGKLLDVNMLAMTGGRERTASEFQDLLAGAGFRLKRIVPTACPLSIVEGRAA